MNTRIKPIMFKATVILLKELFKIWTFYEGVEVKQKIENLQKRL